jgi:hypothetical protein
MASLTNLLTASLLLLIVCIQGCTPTGAPAGTSSPSAVPSAPIAIPPGGLPDTGRAPASRAPLGPGAVVQEKEEARVTDFTIPLYPYGIRSRSGRIKGISPQEKEMFISTIELYSVDSIETIADYYVKSKKPLSRREFISDTGKGVILWDNSSGLPIPGPPNREGTSLVLSMDNKAGKTLLKYTNFKMAP